MTTLQSLSTFLSFVLLFSCQSPSPPPATQVPSTGTTYHVFYLGGQSNMDGYGYNKELPDSLDKPVETVPIFHGNTGEDGKAIEGKGIWASLRPGHGVGFESNGAKNSYSNRFGLELTFAQHLQRMHPNKHIALIKYSRGGTSIDSLAAGDFGCWEPDYQGENGVNQYDHFLATLRNAFTAKDIDGDGAEDQLIPAGILWMQGESDGTLTAEVADRYEAHLKRLMDLVRAAMHSDDLPVVIGRISDSGNHESGKVWAHGSAIRQAQAEFVQKDTRAALVTSTDQYGYSDPWHYDSNGYIDLGYEFAKAMSPLLK